MADPDDQVKRIYGTLAREEPPAALDAAVLAAARRAAGRPSVARRWGVPVSIAAAAVMAVGVALEMHRQEDRGDAAPSAASAPAEKADASAPRMRSAAPEAKPQAPEAKRQPPEAPQAPPFAPRREAGPNLDADRAVGGAAANAQGKTTANAGAAPARPSASSAPPAAAFVPAPAGPFSAPTEPLQLMQATTRGPEAKTITVGPQGAPR